MSLPMRRAVGVVLVITVATVVAGCSKKEKRRDRDDDDSPTRSTPAAATAATGSKELPEECTAYLAAYDCYMEKLGVADRKATVGTLMNAWKDGAAATGRANMATICRGATEKMIDAFKAQGCKPETVPH